MMVSPFVGGLAIGALAVMGTVLVCKCLMRKMAREYELRIRSRDTRIQILLERIGEMEKAKHRRELMRQIERPIE